MNYKKIVGLAITVLAINLCILEDANAATVSVGCRFRATAPGRSRVSIVASGMPVGAMYGVYVKANNRFYNGSVQRLNPGVAKLVWVFDSDPTAIANGATSLRPYSNTYGVDVSVSRMKANYTSWVPVQYIGGATLASCNPI
jgi:hypothetical protein